MRHVPVIDGHNDLPGTVRQRFDSDPERAGLPADLRALAAHVPAGVEFLAGY